MSDEPNEVNFADLHKQIQEHPGMRARRAWDALADVHDVLRANRNELFVFIGAVEQNTNNIGITMISNVGPEEPRRQLYRELIRLVHNYVASAGTLVDHTRKLMARYEGTPIREEYQSRLAEAMKEDLVRFVPKWRNYVLHFGIPGVGVQMTVERPGEQPTFLVFADRDAALRWNNWTVQARRFLENGPKNIPLKDVLFDYARIIDGLYRWLYDQFGLLHGADIAEVNALIERLNRRR